MSIFNPLEKLIVEHGSAVIQEKHISFLRDQLVIIKERFSELEADNKVLKSENAILTEENARLKKQCDQTKKKAPKISDRIPQEQENILKFIYEHDNFPENIIVSQMNLKPQTVKFHLEELRKNDFIRVALPSSNSFGPLKPRPSGWSVEHEGHKYLFENNLLT